MNTAALVLTLVLNALHASQPNDRLARDDHTDLETVHAILLSGSYFWAGYRRAVVDYVTDPTESEQLQRRLLRFEELVMGPLPDSIDTPAEVDAELRDRFRRWRERDPEQLVDMDVVQLKQIEEAVVAKDFDDCAVLCDRMNVAVEKWLQNRAKRDRRVRD